MLEQIELDDIDERLLSETVSALQGINQKEIYGKLALNAQMDFLNTIKEAIKGE